MDPMGYVTGMTYYVCVYYPWGFMTGDGVDVFFFKYLFFSDIKCLNADMYEIWDKTHKIEHTQGPTRIKTRYQLYFDNGAGTGGSIVNQIYVGNPCMVTFPCWGKTPKEMTQALQIGELCWKFCFTHPSTWDEFY